MKELNDHLKGWDLEQFWSQFWVTWVLNFCHFDVIPDAIYKLYNMKRRMTIFPKFKLWYVLWVWVTCGSFVHTILVLIYIKYHFFGLCKLISFWTQDIEFVLIPS